jgi:hypothetical protein
MQYCRNLVKRNFCTDAGFVTNFQRHGRAPTRPSPFSIAIHTLHMLELQVELGLGLALEGLRSPSVAAGTSREWCLPCQTSAGEALSYVQGESLKGSAAVYGGFLLPGHQHRWWPRSRKMREQQ